MAELAKIVQGRPSANSAPPPSAPRPGSGDGLADLEAELLNDLQASFAAVRESLPISQAQPAPAPEPEPEPEPEVEEAPVYAPPPPPVRAAAPPPPPPAASAPPRSESRTELRDEFRLEPIDETRLVPIPAPPTIQPQLQFPTTERPPVAERPPERPPVVERRVERAPEPPPAAVEPAVERPRPPRPPVTAETRPDLGSFQLRGSSGNQPAPPPRQPHSRWEKPEPPKPQPAGASRFAPPKAAAAPPPLETEEELDPFAEGGLFAEHAEPDAEEEFPLEGFGTVPSYGDDADPLVPPFEDDLESLVRRRRPSRNLLIVGAVVAVALVGGIAVMLLNPGSTGTPPVITADGEPTKITPADTTVADADSQNKLIYDRVNSSETSSDTTLITPGDGPINDVATNDSTSPISRVIIPGGPGIDAPASDDALRLDQQPDTVTPPAATTAPAGDSATVAAADTTDPDSIQPIGPRKVRTVVVKPDGTIVSSNATDAGTAPPAATDTATAPPPAATDTATAPPVTDDTAAIAGNGSSELPITALPETAPPADAATTATNTPPPAVTVEPAPVETPPAATTKPPKATTKTTQIANVDNNSQPLDLTQGPKPAASTNGSGGTLVQISSQRSEDAARATYRDLQARYPSILGNYDVNIQRADVPDRGTFYRVRVGPFSASDAQRLCDDLRSAGGDCVLAKR